MTLAGSAVLATGVGQSKNPDEQTTPEAPEKPKFSDRLGNTAFTVASWALLTTWWEDSEATKVRLLEKAAEGDANAIKKLNEMSQQATGNPQSRGWYVETGRKEGESTSYTERGTFDKQGRPVPDSDSRKKG